MDEFTIDQLAVMAKAGNGRAYNALVVRMEGAINSVVSKYSVGNGKAYEKEYRSEAFYGLCKALNSYDEEKGAFVSYAMYAMKSEILNFIKNRQNQITVGTNMLYNVQKVKTAIEAIREEGLDETIDNICHYSGISSKETVGTALWAMRIADCDSLDKSVKDGEETTFADFLSSSENLEEAFLEREEERALLCVVASLPKRDRFIALHSFGIFNSTKMSNLEIAERLGCTPNTVVNRKNAITARIQEAMMEWAS